MESLESRLDRLTPGQRKEAEDFVDFLLSRSGQADIPPPLPPAIPPVLDIAPPPLSAIEPVQSVEIRTVRLQDLARTDDRAVPPAGDEASSAPFHEISGSIQDRITHDYMDYGQSEHHPSPATEAVKKVRRKIIARQEHEKSRHLLDWVD